ncbi:MAG: hypothetical protein AB4372_15715 [Xenococcus sp. (in: cyanobacteria)]
MYHPESDRIIVTHKTLEELENDPTFQEVYSVGNCCFFQLEGIDLARLTYLSDTRNISLKDTLRMAILNDFFLQNEIRNCTSFYALDKSKKISSVVFR